MKRERGMNKNKTKQQQRQNDVANNLLKIWACQFPKHHFFFTA
jgi:hypothetical protein